MILQTVTSLLEEVLGIEKTEITPQANLVDDLAAESIDFVDIVYALEQTYQLTIAPGDIFPAFLQQGSFVDDTGEISAATKARFDSDYPHLDSALLDEFYRDKDPSIFFRVSVLVDFVTTKTNAHAANEAVPA
ncbi:acyl carrier protein [Motilimonas eburnea]|uniref:acyl carrier protein n=1 Tax=Motilimonas eburnea TaxID=1737488 RepID=UPI001E32DE4D|nr:acyl carrier protein [Motilimonas eburnea]MCE2570362.1 acyl carrier protein [Motilimonas eburnea]